MRVALIAPTPPPYGGIANWTKMITQYAQKQRDISMTVINTAPRKRAMDGRNLWDRVVGSGLNMFKKRRELKRIIQEKKPDVIHITTSGQLAIIRDIMLLRLANKYRVPSYYHIHFGRTNQICQENSTEFKLIKRAMRLATKTITIDQITYQAIQKYIPDISTVCMPNPVNINLLPKVNHQESKTILFLGWIIPTKGIEELIDAWQTIHKTYQWKLRLVGPYHETYRRELEDRFVLEGVEFVGEIPHDKAMDALNHAEIFILPSYTEGFPNAVVEAMALEKAIVATDVGAIPDMVAEHCGIVIPAKSSKHIEEALAELIEKPELRKIISENAREKAQKKYALPIVFEQYCHLWSNID